MNEKDIISYSIAFLGAIFLRWTIAANSYSGADNPPMYGDYEAQRHWMEITFNLPIKEWYTNSSRNDLMYWGLDYPPLTAYHSWLCGYLANLWQPKWIELSKSRGFQSQDHKLFMRITVLVADLLVYIAAVFAFFNDCLPHSSKSRKALISGLVLAYPGLVLIDHGHFQYNCISLGFTLWAIVCLLRKKEMLGAVFFSLALNYKQMELYHAFPFFFYLAGLCWKQTTWLRSLFKLLGIGVAVISTFILCWLPFLDDLSSALQVLARIFPVARGLYEDKVANFWCAISVIIKIKTILSAPRILQLCLATTLAACLPSCLNLAQRPTFRRFVLSLVNCSLAFFLFSFQVHEKSILIVALPICLLLPGMPLECIWFLFISVFSMFPLLERDGQALSYFALLMLFFILASLIFEFDNYKKLIKACFLMSVFGALSIHLAAATLKPPSRLPDLFSVMFAVYSCGHFLAAFAYFNYLQIYQSCSKGNQLFTKAEMHDNCI